MTEKQLETNKLVVEKLRKIKDISQEAWGIARQNAKQCYKYVQNEPYTDEQIAAAEEHAKPLLSYPILISKLNTLVGHEQVNRRTCKIISDYQSNEEVVKLLSDNWDYVRENSDLDRKLVKALSDAIVLDTGGWIKRTIEMDENGYLAFQYKQLDSLLVFPDSFRNLDMSDCQYILVEEWLTLDEIETKFGNVADEKQAEQWEEINAQMLDLKDRADGNLLYKNGNRYAVWQLEEKRIVLADLILLETGEYVKATKEDIIEYKKAKIKYNFIRRANDNRIYTTTAVPYFDIVINEKLSDFKTDRLSYFPMFSFDWNMPKKDQRSLFKILMDVADRINKTKSQMVDYMIQMLGSSWHISEFETQAIRDIENSKGKPESLVRYKNIKNKATREYPVGAGQSIGILGQSANEDGAMIDTISNITPNMQGYTERSGESGALFEKKRTQSMTATNPFFEIVAHVRENLTRDFVELAGQVYFEDSRVLPTKPENLKGGLQYELINLNYQGDVIRDIRRVKARAFLDDAENTVNRREKAFEENMAMMQQLIQSGYPAYMLPFEWLIKNSTLRDKHELIEAMQQMKQEMREQQAYQEGMEEFNNVANVAGMLEKRNAAQL